IVDNWRHVVLADGNQRPGIGQECQPPRRRTNAADGPVVVGPKANVRVGAEGGDELAVGADEHAVDRRGVAGVDKLWAYVAALLDAPQQDRLAPVGREPMAVGGVHGGVLRGTGNLSDDRGLYRIPLADAATRAQQKMRAVGGEVDPVGDLRRRAL